MKKAARVDSRGLESDASHNPASLIDCLTNSYRRFPDPYLARADIGR